MLFSDLYYSHLCWFFPLCSHIGARKYSTSAACFLFFVVVCLFCLCFLIFFRVEVSCDLTIDPGSLRAWLLNLCQTVKSQIFIPCPEVYQKEIHLSLTQWWEVKEVKVLWEPIIKEPFSLYKIGVNFPEEVVVALKYECRERKFHKPVTKDLQESCDRRETGIYLRNWQTIIFDEARRKYRDM